MATFRPSVGLLVNPSTPEVMATAGDLVDHLSVIPSRLFYDFGLDSAAAPRFHHPHSWMQMVIEMAGDRSINAHSFGLSLPGAVPLDGELVGAIAQVGNRLGGYAWFSEHLNVMTPGRGGEAHSDTAITLPVSYDEQSFTVLAAKLQQLRRQLGCEILLENPATFTPLIEMEMEEPEFLNRLFHAGHSGILLDLHNLLVSVRNGGQDCQSYLESLDPQAVVEVHLAGGEEFNGFYTDSHSSLTPDYVWRLAYDFLPSCPNLKAITFEYSESYFPEIGIKGVSAELERMHRLAEACRCAPSLSPAYCLGGSHAA
jgi:uncharacterized protein (UPF0276 family)